jgi:hypothetical protein
MSEVDQATYQNIGDKNKALKSKFKKKGKEVPKAENKEKTAIKDRFDKEKC